MTPETKRGKGRPFKMTERRQRIIDLFGSISDFAKRAGKGVAQSKIIIDTWPDQRLEDLIAIALKNRSYTRQELQAKVLQIGYNEVTEMAQQHLPHCSKRRIYEWLRSGKKIRKGCLTYSAIIKALNL